MKERMETIHEKARNIEVTYRCDVCVIGGSCTGVFAAVRAARLGKSVILLEKTNAFGGVATNGMVIAWHSKMDTEFKQQIFAGLTTEVMDRMVSRDAVEVIEGNPHWGYRFNPHELKIELDQLILENGITPLLHTSYCWPIIEESTVKAVLIENKDGRTAIRAGMYVDASGDGDLFAHAGIPYAVAEHLQPPTTTACIRNFKHPEMNYRELYRKHHEEFGLDPDSGWNTHVPGLPGIEMFAQTHVVGVNCANAKDLTHAEIEGRRQVRGVMDMIRKYGPQKGNVALAALPTYIGIRETRRFEAEYCLTEEDVLWGKYFDDTIAQGSYRVDVHYPDGGGFQFKYLDGTTEEHRAGGVTRGRWREPVERDPTYYQIPYRTMVHRRLKNAIMAGRMISSDRGAFGAIRVMVNLNQTGEAAGAAAHIALESGVDVCDVEAVLLRSLLNEGGSCL